MFMKSGITIIINRRFGCMNVVTHKVATHHEDNKLPYIKAKPL